MTWRWTALMQPLTHTAPLVSKQPSGCSPTPVQTANTLLICFLWWTARCHRKGHRAPSWKIWIYRGINYRGCHHLDNFMLQKTSTSNGLKSKMPSCFRLGAIGQIVQRAKTHVLDARALGSVTGISWFPPLSYNNTAWSDSWALRLE